MAPRTVSATGFTILGNAADQRGDKTLSSLCINARQIHQLAARKEPIPTFAAGRRCACGTILSIYNEHSECAACAPDRRPS